MIHVRARALAMGLVSGDRIVFFIFFGPKEKINSGDVWVGIRPSYSFRNGRKTKLNIRPDSSFAESSSPNTLPPRVSRDLCLIICLRRWKTTAAVGRTKFYLFFSTRTTRETAMESRERFCPRFQL